MMKLPFMNGHAEFVGQALESSDNTGLLGRHLSGDRTAFREFVDLYRQRVFSFIVRSGVRGEAAEDLFQDVFLKVHKAASSYNSNLPLEPWLFTIVANTVRSYYRSSRVRELVDAHETEAQQQAANSVDELSEAKETAEWLEAAISTLPPAQREAILLCCVERMEQKEAAQILNIPLNTVKTNLHRARGALAKKLSIREAKVNREVGR